MRNHRVVIVGGGFGGLYAAQGLAHAPVQVTLVDRRNFHLFQPLLYQVASGALSPGDIAAPLRNILARQKNTVVLMGEVIDIDPARRLLTMRDGNLHYDSLVLSPGSDKQYFGHEEWQSQAPGLKSLEDAVKIRRKILLALENAEKASTEQERVACMTFVVVGGGPTGVEMAGTLAELVHATFKDQYRNIDTRQTRILMIEAAPGVLSTYPADLQQKTIERLQQLGVTILTGHTVKSITDSVVTVSHDNQDQEIHTHTVLWTAGVKASSLGRLLADKTGCAVDKQGRVMVAEDCSIPGFPEIFVIGDLSNFSHSKNGKPLPGLASVAMQQGRYVAKVIRQRLQQETVQPFKYRDKGSLAIIGRNAAVAEIGNLHLSGFLAWLVWLLVHIFYLIGFENKVIVTFQWGWSYLTRGRSACLITEQI